MTQHFGRRGAATPASTANPSFPLRGGAALALAIGAGISIMAPVANVRPVLAQEGAGKFVQKDVADQLAKAESVVYRCDKANGRRELDRLKKTKDGLDAAAKSGFVGGAAADAKRLGEEIAHLEQRLTDCSDRHKFTGVNGETYGAFEKDDADDMGKIVEAAKTAAKNCDRLRYRSYVMRVRERANARMRQGLAAPSLYQLAKDLEAAAAELFKHCAEPGKAEAPKEPAKTGTGSTVPNKPPEPPKAPPMTPGIGQAPGRMPANMFGPQNIFLNALYLPTAEFSIALGFRNNNANGHYIGSITAPGTGEGSETRFNFGGGATFWLPFYNFQTGTYFDYPRYDTLRRAAPELAQAGYDDGPDFHEAIAGWVAFQTLALGGRVTLDHLGSGEKRVLELVRHGADGVVTLTESERSMISLLLLVRMSFVIRLGNIGPMNDAAREDQLAETDLAQAPRARRARANWWPVNVYLGGGPSFVRTKITMTSNQVPGGGVFESVSQAKTDTAWSFVLGAQTAVCRACIFGKPLMAGLEGQWTWLPSRSVSLTSSTFGFTETGRVDGRSSARMMFTLSVPFVIR